MVIYNKKRDSSCEKGNLGAAHQVPNDQRVAGALVLAVVTKIVSHAYFNCAE